MWKSTTPSSTRRKIRVSGILSQRSPTDLVSITRATSDRHVSCLMSVDDTKSKLPNITSTVNISRSKQNSTIHKGGSGSGSGWPQQGGRKVTDASCSYRCNTVAESNFTPYNLRTYARPHSHSIATTANSHRCVETLSSPPEAKNTPIDRNTNGKATTLPCSSGYLSTNAARPLLRWDVSNLVTNTFSQTSVKTASSRVSRSCERFPHRASNSQGCADSQSCPPGSKSTAVNIVADATISLAKSELNIQSTSTEKNLYNFTPKSKRSTKNNNKKKKKGSKAKSTSSYSNESQNVISSSTINHTLTSNWMSPIGTSTPTASSTTATQESPLASHSLSADGSPLLEENSELEHNPQVTLYPAHKNNSKKRNQAASCQNSSIDSRPPSEHNISQVSKVTQGSIQSVPNNIQLTAIIEELCLQVSNLESIVKSLNKKINDLTNQKSNAPAPSKTCENATQTTTLGSPNKCTTPSTTTTPHPKNAPKINNNPQPSEKTQSNQKSHCSKHSRENSSNDQFKSFKNIVNTQSKVQTKPQLPSPSKGQNQQTQSNSHSHSSPKSIWFDSFGTPLDPSDTINSNNTKLKGSSHYNPDPNHHSSNLPNVWLIHDSIFRDINENQLGSSFDFFATKIQANRIEQISKAVESTLSDLYFENPPETIVIQTGINNIRTINPEQTSKQLVNEIQKIKTKIPSAKFIIHHLAPTKIKSLNTKAKLHNALIDYLTEPDPDISTMHGTLLANKYNMTDELHPSQKGTSILACTLGRFVRNSLWSIQPSHKRPNRKSYYHNV